MGSLLAQKEENPLRKIVSNYSPGNGVLSTKLKYFYYKDAGKRVLLDSMTISYVESKNGLYTNYEGEEIVSLDELTIVILNSVQTIAMDESKRVDNRFVSISNLYYLSNHKESYRLLKNKGKSLCRIYNPGGEVDSLDIYYNEQNFLISKIALFFENDYVPALGLSPGAFLEIEYVKYSKSKSIEHPSLKLSSYIVKSDDGWKATGKYSSYKISN